MKYLINTKREKYICKLVSKKKQYLNFYLITKHKYKLVLMIK